MIAYFQKLYESFVYQDLFLIFISIFVGLIVGAEREYKNKTAGLRTLMLVCLGSCIFTILSLKIGIQNPDRLAANIITGIGFLGAGVIYKDENKINGVTTACSIWVTAALGMAIGSGHIYLALLSTSFTLLVLWILVFLEKWIDKTNRVRTYKITTQYNSDVLIHFEKTFYDFKLKYNITSQLKNANVYIITFRIEGSMKNHDNLSAFLLNDAIIHQVEL